MLFATTWIAMGCSRPATPQESSQVAVKPAPQTPIADKKDELGQQSLSGTPGPPEEGQQCRGNRQQQPEHVGIGKVHGSLLQRVWRSRTSSSSNPKPGEIAIPQPTGDESEKQVIVNRTGGLESG